jgi:F-box/leucine-rich repeat protein 10/11
VDYAGLNEGILKTSDDNPEHHYIQAFKSGELKFLPETFARLPPECVTADFIEKMNGFTEPVVIPASLNPRPNPPQLDGSILSPHDAPHNNSSDEPYGYEMAPDEGQDKIDMVIPEGLTVRRVSELYGPSEPVPVIDVKAQEGEDKRWTMAKWADYYEQSGEKPVRNVISLEVSRSRLGRLIRRPKVVRDMDLQDSVWPEEDKARAPPVQFYCLMSVADCYTDFHIDFGGSSVYYHIIKGKKTFFFIPPTKSNLKKYEDWCLSQRQSHEFLGLQVKECYRVDLSPGDTMLIPSGWIHAVWTPEDSLVIGGNYLTRCHFGMQIKVLEIEKNTKVAPKFRYPFFQKIMWLSLIRYLEDDPLPPSVESLLLSGEQFERSVPIFCEPDKFGHNSDLGPENYNRRYYPKAELEGLPDLANYIWRTVMISQGRIEGITQQTRNAVTRSIPKGHGEPLILARRFAMWIAWKRGNERIPQWAHPDSSLPEAPDSKGEKKLSAAQLKKLERESWNETLKLVRGGERHSSLRARVSEPSPNGDTQAQTQVGLPVTGFLRPSREHVTTPKTSQLGPKRIACDACRKRRIRCKHKDEIIETPGSTAPMSGSINGSPLGPSSTPSFGTLAARRYSDADVPSGPVPYPVYDAQANTNGGPVSADLNTDALANKSGRVKACADCRKSKVRLPISFILT